MDYLVPKAPADTCIYFIDWSKQLPDGDLIETFELTVSSGTVTVPQTPDNFGDHLRFLLAGGANGELAILSCTVHTVALQVMTRELQLYIADGVVPLAPSTCAKRAVCEMAFEECGLAGYEFDKTPEEWQSALRRLDALQAEWRSSGLDLDYNAPAVLGDGDLDDASGIPDDAVNATALSLALRICPPLGKAWSAESRIAYTVSMDLLRARYLSKPERALPAGTPRGAGNKPWSTWWPYGAWGQVRRSAG